MRILRVRLVNVKSFVDAEIAFEDGVHFISGVNGAGKTTLIESIGYALFDYRPYAARHFVRYGQRKGRVEVVFEASDERVYRVVREVGGAGNWRAFDEESGAEIQEVHGGRDMVRWLKERLGVPEEDDLTRLFEEVIAVDQGKFIAPFLETPAKRQEIFHHILHIDGYRTAYQQTSGLPNRIKGQIEALRREMAMLEEAAAKLPEVQAQRDERAREIRRLEEEQGELRRRYEAIQREVERLEEMRARKEGAENRRAEWIRKTALLAQQIEQLQRERDEAEAARETAERARPGYDRYVAAEQEARQLERRIQEKEELERRIAAAEAEFQRIRGALEAEERHVAEQERALAARREVLEQEWRQWAVRKKASEEQLQRAEGWNGFTVPVRQALEAWGRRLEESAGAAAALRREGAALAETAEAMTRAEELVRELPAVEAALSVLPGLREREAEIAAREAALAARLEVMRQNRAVLGDGVCPLVGEPCPSQKVREAGDLAAFFDAEIARVARATEAVRKRREEVQREIARLREEEIRAEVLRREAGRLAELEERWRRGWAQISARLEGIAEDGPARRAREAFEEQWRTLRERWAGLQAWWADQQVLAARGEAGADMEDAPPVRDLPEESWHLAVPEVEPSVTTQTAVQEARRASGTTRRGTDPAGQAPDGEASAGRQRLLAVLDAALSAWEERARLFVPFREEVLSRLDRLDRALDRIVQEVRWQRQEAEGHLRRLRQEGTAWREESERLNRRREGIRERRAEAERLQARAAAWREQLAGFEGLAERLAEVRGVLEKHREDYQMYLVHHRAAARLGEILEALGRAKAESQACREELRRAEEELARLARDYDPEVHRRRVLEAREVFGALQALESKTEAVRQWLERLEAEVAALLEKRQRLEELGRELAVKQKTAELTGLVRDTLNRAADPIARVFRRRLSHAANQFHRQISQENVQLEWGDQYEVMLKDADGGRERVRVFR
ncbi:MAG: AAA family ATPase, partial [Alicyclobacillaceae bacterium]|nr:AAA family ATPase [Alicyclobacillaceae bacterium]